MFNKTYTATKIIQTKWKKIYKKKITTEISFLGGNGGHNILAGKQKKMDTRKEGKKSSSLSIRKQLDSTSNQI